MKERIVRKLHYRMDVSKECRLTLGRVGGEHRKPSVSPQRIALRISK